MKPFKFTTFYAGIRLKTEYLQSTNAFCFCASDVAVVAAVDDCVTVVAQLVSCVETGGQ